MTTALLSARLEFDTGDGAPVTAQFMSGTLGELQADIEAWFISTAVSKTETRVNAAKMLGMGRTTLVEKLARRRRAAGDDDLPGE